MEQPQGDSEADILQKLEGFFDEEQAAPEEQEPVAEASEQEVEGDEQPEEAEDAGLVELETEDGEIFRVPQTLKDGYLRQSDYTKKTQDLANLQRNAQAVLQQQALMATFLFFAPAILLSGFMFPIENMPAIFQYATYLNPLRYFLVIIRGIFLKGNGLGLLWLHLLRPSQMELGRGARLCRQYLAALPHQQPFNVINNVLIKCTPPGIVTWR